MYQNQPYGLYKFGYLEDLESITPENLYTHYQKLLQECKIDIFASGDIDKEELVSMLMQNEQIQKLQDRKPNFIGHADASELEIPKTPNKVTESMNVSQGKLILGMYVDSKKPDDKYVALLYNAILGGNANSKLFQNVREKASLAYTASSSYIRPKNIIFIKCGIEIENEAKTLEIIEKQLQDIKKGEFSEEEIEICKKQIISAIKGIPEGQDTEIIYYYGQEIAGENVSLKEYIQKVNAVTKQDIIALAQMINVHTVYFLKD